MDWKTCAVDELRRYRPLKIGILNSRDKLRLIDSSAKSAGVHAAEKGARTPGRTVDTLVESERLRSNLKYTESLVNLIERGLSVLTEEEKQVLEKFYISDSPVNLSHLKLELGYEERTLYRLRDRALKKFTLAMYGIDFS